MYPTLLLRPGVLPERKRRRRNEKTRKSLTSHILCVMVPKLQHIEPLGAGQGGVTARVPRARSRLEVGRRLSLEGEAMRCPFCHADSDKVVDSRSVGEGEAIRRRRECRACGRRFTTYERMEQAPLKVLKKNGQREPFDRRKLLHGLEKACEKRPVSSDLLEEEALRIESQLHSMYDREVPSSVIGEWVMRRLRALDEVAYIRFASVYRAFKDVSEFIEEATPMMKPPRKPRGEPQQG